MVRRVTTGSPVVAGGGADSQRNGASRGEEPTSYADAAASRGVGCYRRRGSHPVLLLSQPAVFPGGSCAVRDRDLGGGGGRDVASAAYATAHRATRARPACAREARGGVIRACARCTGWERREGPGFASRPIYVRSAQRALCRLLNASTRICRWIRYRILVHLPAPGAQSGS